MIRMRFCLLYDQRDDLKYNIGNGTNNQNIEIAFQNVSIRPLHQRLNFEYFYKKEEGPQKTSNAEGSTK